MKTHHHHHPHPHHFSSTTLRKEANGADGGGEEADGGGDGGAEESIRESIRGGEGTGGQAAGGTTGAAVREGGGGEGRGGSPHAICIETHKNNSHKVLGAHGPKVLQKQHPKSTSTKNTPFPLTRTGRQCSVCMERDKVQTLAAPTCMHTHARARAHNICTCMHDPRTHNTPHSRTAPLAVATWCACTVQRRWRCVPSVTSQLAAGCGHLQRSCALRGKVAGALILLKFERRITKIKIPAASVLPVAQDDVRQGPCLAVSLVEACEFN